MTATTQKITEASLSTLTTAAITTIYNEIAPTVGMNPVKRFADKPTAIKRAVIAAQTHAEISKPAKPAKPAKAKTAEPKAPKEPKVQTVRNKGPRGFRVDSPAWLKSISEGKGIAASPANFPKLKDTADVHGVSAEGLDQPELLKAISEAMANAAPTETPAQ